MLDHRLLAFEAVLQEGSFERAARRLGKLSGESEHGNANNESDRCENTIFCFSHE